VGVPVSTTCTVSGTNIDDRGGQHHKQQHDGAALVARDSFRVVNAGPFTGVDLSRRGGKPVHATVKLSSIRRRQVEVGARDASSRSNVQVAALTSLAQTLSCGRAAVLRGARGALP
jgi:hypothetical protein